MQSCVCGVCVGGVAHLPLHSLAGLRSRRGKTVLVRLEEVLQDLGLHILEQFVGEVLIRWVGHLDVILQLGLCATAYDGGGSSISYIYIILMLQFN